MKHFILIFFYVFLTSASCMGQDVDNIEITGEYFYYELTIPGNEEKSRWPIVMTGVSSEDVLGKIASITSFEDMIKSFYTIVTFCPDIFMGYMKLMSEMSSEKKDYTLDALSLQDAIAEISTSLNLRLAEGISYHLDYCRMKATFVKKNSKDYGSSNDGSEFLAPDQNCMVLKDIDYLILPFQMFKSKYLNDFYKKTR